MAMLNNQMVMFWGWGSMQLELLLILQAMELQNHLNFGMFAGWIGKDMRGTLSNKNHDVLMFKFLSGITSLLVLAISQVLFLISHFEHVSSSLETGRTWLSSPRSWLAVRRPVIFHRENEWTWWLTCGFRGTLSLRNKKWSYELSVPIQLCTARFCLFSGPVHQFCLLPGAMVYTHYTSTGVRCLTFFDQVGVCFSLRCSISWSPVTSCFGCSKVAAHN